MKEKREKRKEKKTVTMTKFLPDIKKWQTKSLEGILVFVVIFTFLSFIFNLSKARAEGIALKVSPPILQIEAIPPTDFRAPFTIENPSDDPVSLKIIFRPFKSTFAEDGTLEYITEKDLFPGADKDIFEKVAVVDENLVVESLELGPRQKKELELYAHIPKGAPYSDYYFSIIFLTQPQNAGPTPSLDNGNTSSAQAGIAINVLLSVGPKNDAKGQIEEFGTNNFFEDGPVPFTLRVKNTGSRFISPRGLILIKNMFGQAVGRVEIAETNILSGTTRALASDTPLPENTRKGDSPQIIWPERFLLGYYTATLSLALSEDGPLYTREVHFMAFPGKLLIGLLIAVGIVFVIIRRIRKLSTR